MGGGRIFLKTFRASLFNEGLLNEPNFGRIRLAGQYGTGMLSFMYKIVLHKSRGSSKISFVSGSPWTPQKKFKVKTDEVTRLSAETVF